MTLADLLAGSVDGLLAQVLLSDTHHDDLLLFLRTCAQVCRAWRSVACGSAAYGLVLARTQLPGRQGLSSYEGDEDERARVLKTISAALRDARSGFEEYREQRPPGTLDLDFSKLGDGGVHVLGTALQALPSTSPGILNLCLSCCELTSAAAIEPILETMRPGFACARLRWLNMSQNTGLGRPGRGTDSLTLSVLARSLPLTMEWLELEEIDCGDDGMIALAAELPRLTSLLTLALNGNDRVTESGWASLSEALPLLPVLQDLRLAHCGMGSPTGRKLAEVLPRCTKTLSSFWLSGSHFDDLTVSQLRVAWGARTTDGMAFANLWSPVD